MTTKVEKSIEVDVPVSTAYNQWTQFEQFPRFMGGVQEVRQTGDTTLHWVAEIAGVKREWDAVILEQVPDRKVAWAATSGATNAGAVYFTPADAEHTTVTLSLEYEPEGLVENVGDKLNVVERRAEADLEKFKSYIESRGIETGAWRGSVNEGMGVGTPGTEAAAASRGDSGKAGVSGKAVAAGAVGAAAVAGAAAAAMKGRSQDTEEDRMADTTGYTGRDHTSRDYTSSDLAAEPLTPATGDVGMGTGEHGTAMNDPYATGTASDEPAVDELDADPYDDRRMR